MLKVMLAAIAMAMMVCCAQAQTCSTTITEPCTITTNGAHILGATLNITGRTADPASGLQVGIKIAPGVSYASINCSEYGIYHDGPPTSRSAAIYGSTVANVDIFGCTLFGSGLLYGVQIDNESSPAFASITVRDSVISVRHIGVLARSGNVHVSNVLFREIGGQRIWSDGYPGAISIYGLGGSARVENNVIAGLHNYFASETFGVACTGCTSGVISGNKITNSIKLAASWAFWINPTSYTIADNEIENFAYGFGLVSSSGGTISGTGFNNVDVHYSSMPASWTITP